jgi:hypothetical protein
MLAFFDRSGKLLVGLWMGMLMLLYRQAEIDSCDGENVVIVFCLRLIWREHWGK